MTWSPLGTNSWRSTTADGTSPVGTKAWPAAATTIGDLGLLVVVLRGTADPAVHSDWAPLASSVSAETASTGQASIYLYAHVYAGTAPDMTWVTPAMHAAVVSAYRHSTETSYTIGTPAVQQTNTAIVTHTLAGGVAVSATDSLIIVAAGNGRGQGYSNTRATTPATGSGATDTISDPSASAWIERGDNGAISTYSFRAALFDALLDSGTTGDILTTIGAGSKGTLIGVAIKPGAAGAAGTVDVNNPAERTVYDGASGSATVTLGGTYTGTASAVEVQIERTTGGAVEVPWTTIDAAPAGGVWSGSVSIPRGGWYTAKVRKSAYPEDTLGQTTSKWGVGLIVGALGQSHLDNFSSSGSGTPDDRASQCAVATVTAMSTTGAGRIAFTNALIALADCPVTLVDYGVPGTLLSFWYTTGGGTSSYYDAWAARVTAAGGALSAFVLWQGDANAQAGTSRADYLQQMVDLEAKVQLDFGAPLTAVCHLGRYGSGADSTWSAIRAAHVEFCAADADRRGVVTLDLEHDAGLQHFTDAGSSTGGVRLAHAIADWCGETSDGTGPVVSSAAYYGTRVRVQLTHDAGTDISPSTGITALSVLDNGTPVAVASASRYGQSALDITVGSTLVGPVVVRHGYGAYPDVSAIALDNTPTALPLWATADDVSAVLDPAVESDALVLDANVIVRRTPAPGDKRLYLTSSGLKAAASPASGDRPISVVGGARQAGAATP